MAKRLTMNTRKGKPFSEVWGEFITSQTAKGVAEITLRNYRQVHHNITRFFDVETQMDELSKSDFEKMVVEMRGADLAHNTIATYLRVIRTFLNWCQREGIISITIPNIKEKETVKHFRAISSAIVGSVNSLRSNETMRCRILIVLGRS